MHDFARVSVQAPSAPWGHEHFRHRLGKPPHDLPDSLDLVSRDIEIFVISATS